MPQRIEGMKFASFLPVRANTIDQLSRIAPLTIEAQTQSRSRIWKVCLTSGTTNMEFPVASGGSLPDRPELPGFRWPGLGHGNLQIPFYRADCRNSQKLGYGKCDG